MHVKIEKRKVGSSRVSARPAKFKGKSKVPPHQAAFKKAVSKTY